MAESTQQENSIILAEWFYMQVTYYLKLRKKEENMIREAKRKFWAYEIIRKYAKAEAV